MEYLGPENRRSKRIKKPFVLRLQRLSGTAPNEWSFIFLKDISKGGLCFSSNDEMKEGEVLRMKINVGRNAPPVHCSGEVIRVQRTPKGSMLDIAVIFMDIAPEDVDAIEKAVSEQIEDPEV